MNSLTRLWSSIEAEAEFAASPTEVFAVLADPWTYPEWLVGAQDITSVDPSFPAKNAEFRHAVGPTEEVTVKDRSNVVEVAPPHRLVLRVHVGPFQGIVDLLVTPNGTGSRVRFGEWLEGPIAAITPIVRPILYLRNVESLRRLGILLNASPS